MSHKPRPATNCCRVTCGGSQPQGEVVLHQDSRNSSPSRRRSEVIDSVQWQCPREVDLEEAGGQWISGDASNLHPKTQWNHRSTPQCAEVPPTSLRGHWEASTKRSASDVLAMLGGPISQQISHAPTDSSSEVPGGRWGVVCSPEEPGNRESWSDASQRGGVGKNVGFKSTNGPLSCLGQDSEPLTQNAAFVSAGDVEMGKVEELRGFMALKRNALASGQNSSWRPLKLSKVHPTSCHTSFLR